MSWRDCICITGEPVSTDCPQHGCICEGERNRLCNQHGDEARFWERADYEYCRGRDK